MTRFSIDDEEEEDTPALIVKRPRLSDNASESHTPVPPSQGQPDDVVPVPEMQNQRQSDGDVAVANRTANMPIINNMKSSVGLVGMRVFVTDTDVLDCPICLDPLSTPVFQCENGHIACSSCCKKVKRKCPCCCMPIGYNRCRAVEKVIESVKVSCKNARYGCRRILTYSKQTHHEQMCKHAACFCPHPSCPFSGSSKNMYLHFGMQHAVSTTRFTYDITFFVNVELHQKHIFLQEQHESVVFILNHEVKEHGRALNVDCVGLSTLKACFVCDITVSDPVSSLYLRTVPDVYTKWSEHSLRKMYLTIPSDLFGTGTMCIQLCIKKVLSPA